MSTMSSCTRSASLPFSGAGRNVEFINGIRKLYVDQKDFDCAGGYVDLLPLDRDTIAGKLYLGNTRILLVADTLHKNGKTFYGINFFRLESIADWFVMRRLVFHCPDGFQSDTLLYQFGSKLRKFIDGGLVYTPESGFRMAYLSSLTHTLGYENLKDQTITLDSSLVQFYTYTAEGKIRDVSDYILSTGTSTELATGEKWELVFENEEFLEHFGVDDATWIGFVYRIFDPTRDVWTDLSGRIYNRDYLAGLLGSNKHRSLPAYRTIGFFPDSGLITAILYSFRL